MYFCLRLKPIASSQKSDCSIVLGYGLYSFVSTKRPIAVTFPLIDPFQHNGNIVVAFLPLLSFPIHTC